MNFILLKDKVTHRLRKNLYDRVQREVLWRCLNEKRLSLAYIQVVKDMHDGSRTSVRTPGGVTKDFPVVIGMH